MLKGYQKQFLRGLAHPMSPLVMIGKKGCTPELIKELEATLTRRELIKIKFIDFKEKEDKENILAQIGSQTGAGCVGKVGHTAVLFRQNKNPEKRKIKVPAR
jgi:RNA-binding protein